MVTRPRHLLRDMLSSLCNRGFWLLLSLILFFACVFVMVAPIGIHRAKFFTMERWVAINPERAYLRLEYGTANPSALNRASHSNKMLGLRYGLYTMTAGRDGAFWGSKMSGNYTVRYLDVPVLLLMVLTLSYPVFARVQTYKSAWREQRVVQRIKQGRCPRCNYDLRGQMYRCPECGLDIAQATES